MIHREDYNCGLRSEGDTVTSDPKLVDCPKCKRPQIGTPISQLSGRPGHPGYEEFCRIAESWGYP